MKLTALFFFVLSALSSSIVSASPWVSWKNGDIRAAEAEARKLLVQNKNEALHVLSLTSAAQGKFALAIHYQAAIGRDYPRYEDTVSTAIEAYKHLDNYQLAYRFALRHEIGSEEIRALKQLSKRRPRFEIPDTVIIPFKTNEPLNPLLPAFEMSVNGASLIGHLDTGGTFLVMSSELADRLKIKYFYYGKGHCNNSDAKLWFAQTNISLGGLNAINVPTLVSDCINNHPPMNVRVIFGTNLLQRFLSTIDYPNQRLILSPYHRRRHHFEIANEGYSDFALQNFHIWSDHFMFTRGNFGGQTRLNFFVDSGLVTPFSADGRQPAFSTSTGNLLKWGFDPSKLAKNRVVPVNGSLGLAGLNQDGHVCVHQKEISFGDFGGVEIHGMIGHAYLQKYSWTLDFKRMTYQFARK